MNVVEDQNGGLVNEENFPVGMRVLAVDDDPICLKVLENLLRRCQYQVTTTNQAIQALKMLRDNRNKYDLVISDVNMPDMDGFKLLELVGLEMDIPVIMLSAHSDKELVYKGVTHGAVDYLLKPVRLEELKNIWQHVVRKKKLSPKEQNKTHTEDKCRDVVGESGQGAASSGSTDQNGRVNRKRKDQEEDDDEESEENGQESEEPGTQKKPRVVWSVELHRKFVTAVNQLGYDKAVPKKILDLMNVEGLTRENVASHLQKYRLYLKKCNNATSHHANIVSAFGKDSSYLRMGSLDGFGDFRTMSGPGRLSTTTLSSYTSGGMLGRLNSPASFTLRGNYSSSLLQPGQSQNLSSSVTSLGKLQPSLVQGNQATNLFQGIQSSLEVNQLQNKPNTHIGEFRSDDPMGLTVPTAIQDSRATLSGLGNIVPSASSNPLMLQVNPQHSQSRGTFAIQSSLNVPSLTQESFDIGGRGSSNFLDHNRCTENWQGAVQLSKFPSNSFPNEGFSHDPLTASNLRDNMPSTSAHIGNSQVDFSSSSALAAPLEGSRVDMQGQAGLIGNVIQNMNYASKQRWEEPVQDYNPSVNDSFSSMSSLVSSNCIAGPMNQGVDQRKGIDPPLMGQLNNGAPANGECFLEQTKPQNGFAQNSYDSFDDLMNAVIKRDHNDALLMDGEFGIDAYSHSLGSCM